MDRVLIVEDDTDINNFINKAFITCDYKGFILILFLRARVFR